MENDDIYGNIKEKEYSRNTRPTSTRRIITIYPAVITIYTAITTRYKAISAGRKLTGYREKSSLREKSEIQGVISRYEKQVRGDSSNENTRFSKTVL